MKKRLFVCVSWNSYRMSHQNFIRSTKFYTQPQDPQDPEAWLFGCCQALLGTFGGTGENPPGPLRTPFSGGGPPLPGPRFSLKHYIRGSTFLEKVLTQLRVDPSEHPQLRVDLLRVGVPTSRFLCWVHKILKQKISIFKKNFVFHRRKTIFFIKNSNFFAATWHQSRKTYEFRDESRI